MLGGLTRRASEVLRGRDWGWDWGWGWGWGWEKEGRGRSAGALAGAFDTAAGRYQQWVGTEAMSTYLSSSEAADRRLRCQKACEPPFFFQLCYRQPGFFGREHGTLTSLRAQGLRGIGPVAGPGPGLGARRGGHRVSRRNLKRKRSVFGLIELTYAVL